MGAGLGRRGSLATERWCCLPFQREEKETRESQAARRAPSPPAAPQPGQQELEQLATEQPPGARGGEIKAGLFGCHHPQPALPDRVPARGLGSYTAL